MVVALIAVGVLAGVGPTFPRDVAGGASWDFLATHGVPAAHALLGTLVVVGAATLTWVAHRKLLPSLILLGVVTSWAAGMLYVQARQPDGALTTMTVGWLFALGASVTALIETRRPASTT
jgi:uncharacterized MnhB-related membrane protein